MIFTDLYCDDVDGGPRLPRRDCEGCGGGGSPSRAELPGPNIPARLLMTKRKEL